MVDLKIDLASRRAHEARISRSIGKRNSQFLLAASLIFIAFAIGLGVAQGLRYSFFLLAPAAVCLMPALWWQRYLSVLPPTKTGDLTSRLSLNVLSRLKPGKSLTKSGLWEALSHHWQANFMLGHLLISSDEVALVLEKSTDQDPTTALKIAVQLADKLGSAEVELGFVIAGLMASSDDVAKLLISFKARPEDVYEVADWLGRNIIEHDNRDKQNFGGIGRDWAFGFTPLLDRLGTNLSLSIAKYNVHFGSLVESAGVKAMEAAFDNHASAIALIGPIGIGKSNSVYALAQRLIEGKTSQSLAYHQVVSISATDILSNARGAGALERIMTDIANEASHAGHIILFLDDAEAFFSSVPGSFDGSQLLASMVQSKVMPMIMAFTPAGFERVKASNQALAGLVTPIVLQELDQASVMRVLEDSAIAMESRNQVMIAYEALMEAYRLSGRYEQDEAYPGKAIKLLERSIPYSIGSIVSGKSVQHAVEQTSGVKLTSASPIEADELLNLENKIHQRMINQTQAVSSVANSLRRARAGVTNPNRPIGSFLFLGPTGVGKTELAKSLAASYFNAESNMIRLDMSEYQQASDVDRLLSDGSNEAKSLIMAVRRQPFSVILLDEIEKSHPNILNLLLQLLDEGQLTDQQGRVVSFKDSIIIATSNAGAQFIRDHVEKGETIDKFRSALIEELIKSAQFKPELINRFDDIVLFRPLNQEELAQVVGLMLGEINKTLSNQNISVSLTDAATSKIVAAGYDPRLGARPMRRTLQRAVEDTMAQKILKGETKPGDKVVLDEADLRL